MPASFVLGKDLERLIRRLIESGRYNSKSEVVRDALRRLAQDEDERATKLRELRRAYRAGLASGPARSDVAVFERLESKLGRRRRSRSVA
jgi:antitoxin ParD1/3/4